MYDSVIIFKKGLSNRDACVCDLRVVAELNMQKLVRLNSIYSEHYTNRRLFGFELSFGS